MCDDTEEITLPTLPSSELMLPVFTSSKTASTRKRPFPRSYKSASYEEQLAEALSTSSDPALFSSDETPDAENYDGSSKRRKKKTYEGTWWGGRLRKTRRSTSASTTGPTKKREFRRNIDSGIFMNDDTSGTDLSSEGLLEQELLNDQEKEKTRRKEEDPEVDEAWDIAYGRKVHRSFRFSKDEALKRFPLNRPVNPKDQLIRKVIQECLDKNKENVDFTDWGLDYLPPAITDLKSMIKRIDPQVGDSTLAPFEAELKVYLANNDFSNVPEPLLELKNIWLLSLRQNRLSDLPPGIRNLTNLRELNLASNNLKYLPFEVLELLRYGSLRIIHRSPNPWMPPPTVNALMDNVPTITFYSRKKVFLRRLAVSKVQEIGPMGTSFTTDVMTQLANKQPHLSEVVLRALLRHNKSRTNLTSCLSDSHPDSVKKLLTMLHSAQTSGGRTCTFCKREIVLPRYQWYEWWDVVHEEGLLKVYKAHAPGLEQLDMDFTLEEPSTIGVETSSDLPEVVYERLIPFQRMACGCTDVTSGMLQEARKFVQDLTALTPNSETLPKWRMLETPAV